MNEQGIGITTDEETGKCFVNNELIVVLDSSLSKEEADAFIAGFDATVDRGLEHYKMYRLIFDRPYTYSELDQLATEIKSSEIVKDAFISFVFQLEPDEEGSLE